MAVPGAPSGINLLNVSYDRVGVSIVNGSNGGKTITQWEVAYSTSFGSVNDYRVTFGSTNGNVLGLTASTTWSFRARAYNADGWGAWSGTYTATTSAAPVPNAPTVYTGATTSTTVAVDIYDGANNGSAIIGRQIGYSTVLGRLDYIVNANPSTIISGLSPGTTWSFRARTMNAAGWGPWSGVAGATTQGAPTTRPAAPSLSLSRNDAASVLAQITDGDNGGAVITARQIGYSTTFGALTFIADVVGLQRVIDNLTPGETWSFRARTANANGWGAWSSTYTFTLPPATRPPPPSNVWTGTTTRNSIAVHTVVAADGGSPITKFQVGYSPTFGKIEFVHESTASMDIIGSLTSNAEWYFRSRVFNRFGWSDWSGAVAKGKTLAGVPLAPGPAVITDATRTSVKVTFTPPALKDQGGLPLLEMRIGYGRSAAAPELYKVSAGESIVEKLISGQKYYFWTQARNEMGWGPLSPVREISLVSAIYVTLNGVPRQVIPYVNDNGVWKVAQPWAKMSGFWRAL